MATLDQHPSRDGKPTRASDRMGAVNDVRSPAWDRISSGPGTTDAAWSSMLKSSLEFRGNSFRRWGGERKASWPSRFHHLSDCSRKWYGLLYMNVNVPSLIF